MSELQKEVLPQEIPLRGMSASHRLSATKFLEQVLELGAKGYVLHPKPATLRQVPSFIGAPRATMVTEAYAKEIMEGAVKEAVVPAKAEVVEVVATDKVEKELTSLEKIELFTKKGELLELAKQLEIEVPEDNVKKGPKSIKQFLINTLSE